MNAKSAIRALKVALSSTLLMGVCWAAAIAWWRARAHLPTAGEIIVCLFLLPLGLLRLCWGGYQLRAEHASSAAASAASSAAPAAPPDSAPPRAPVLAILGASLRLPYAASAPALAAALTAGLADKPLRADPDLADAALRDAIQAWLAANGLADLRFSDGQWRALVLATEVSAELAGQAVSLLMPAGEHTWLPCPLRLIPLLPADWNSAQRRAASQWLEHTVAQAGWPAGRIERARTSLPGPDEASPAAPFGHLAHAAVLTNAPLSALVVACASDGGAAQGSVGGEGAAGLLVLDERQARAIEGATSVRLDALREARRDSSADAGPPADPALLAGLIDGALAHARVAPAEVAMVVADTGERSARMRELVDSVAALSRLAPAEDIACMGKVCGNGGGSGSVVAFIAGLALARHQALARARPVLCVSNEDAYRRIAALVRPAAAP